MIIASMVYTAACLALGFAMVAEAIRRESTRTLLRQRRALLGQRACGVFMAASGVAQYAAVSFSERDVVASAMTAIAAMVLLGQGTALRRRSRQASGPDLPGGPLEAKLAGPLLLMIVSAAIGGRVWLGVAAAASILALGELLYWLHWLISDQAGQHPNPDDGQVDASAAVDRDEDGDK
jgi:hypothetical protein